MEDFDEDLDLEEGPKVFTRKKHAMIMDDTGEHLNIKEFDFKKPSKFAKDHIRLLEIVHDSFATISETHLSMQTRTTVEISLNMIEQTTFGGYIESLSDRCYICTLKAPIFDGDVVLQFREEAAFAILDRLLGGKGTEKVEREMSEIEINLMNGIIKDMLSSFKDAWVNVAALDMKIKDVETNPQFIRAVVSNEMCLVLNFGITINEEMSYFTFCLPYSSIKPVLDKLSTRSWLTDGKTLHDASKGNMISKNITGVDLEASVILGETKATISEIQNLEKGDVIRLSKGVSKPMDMSIGEHNIFKYSPV